MILLLSLVISAALCNAQSGSAFSQASSSGFGGTPLSQSNAFSGSSGPQAGSSSSASASSQATAVAGAPDYASCVLSQPDTAVRSRSRFAYSLLESTFTNPALKDIYNTAFNLDDIYQVISEELQATSVHDARTIAGSLSLTFGTTYPRISPLVNAVTITNALSGFLALKVVITTEEFDDYVDAFINEVSKGLRNEDGSPKSAAKAIVSALLNFLARHGELSFSCLHEFISILNGNYRMALYSNCLPSTFEEIPNPAVVKSTKFSYFG